MSDKISITSPVGRIVQGSLYKPSTKDLQGNPLVIKNGPNAGQPRVTFWVKIAIPKGQEQHWAQTTWGQQIYAVGNKAFPQFSQAPSFAWKIEDGDNAIPNPERKGKKNCDQEGWKGNWILKISGGFAPKIVRQNNGRIEEYSEADAVKPGHYVEVLFSAEGNNTPTKPGIYLNFVAICFRGFGPEIVFGPDLETVGFGAGALPPGASVMPPPTVAAPFPQPGVAPAVPGFPITNAPFPTISALPATISPSNPVIPNPGFANGPKRIMLPAAQGASYEQLIAAGWNDAQLIAQGLMSI